MKIGRNVPYLVSNFRLTSGKRNSGETPFIWIRRGGGPEEPGTARRQGAEWRRTLSRVQKIAVSRLLSGNLIITSSRMLETVTTDPREEPPGNFTGMPGDARECPGMPPNWRNLHYLKGGTRQGRSEKVVLRTEVKMPGTCTVARTEKDERGQEALQILSDNRQMINGLRYL